MNMNQENTKQKLAQNLKAILNSPEYVAVPELLGHENRCGDMFFFLVGSKLDGNIHKEENWINGKNINPEAEEENKHVVNYSELEPADWEEIVNLVKKRNKEKKQAFEKRWAEIQEKMNNTPGLYYFWGMDDFRRKRGERANVWCERKAKEEEWKELRGFLQFSGKENGRTHHLNIAEEHPILDNFSFEKGFYLIDTDRPIEKSAGRYDGYGSTGGENNPHNFHKWVEAEDQITITSENGEKISAKKVDRERKVSDKNFLAVGKAEKETGSTGNNLISKANENESKLVAVKAETKPSATENERLTQILHAISNLEQRIAELEKTGRDPQQVKVLKQQVKNLEIQKQNQLTSDKQKELNISTKTNEANNSQIANNPTQSNNTALLITGGILIIGAALMIGYLLGKDNKKTNQ